MLAFRECGWSAWLGPLIGFAGVSVGLLGIVLLAIIIAILEHLACRARRRPSRGLRMLITSAQTIAAIGIGSGCSHSKGDRRSPHKESTGC
jgi:hypothetical protein